MKAISFSKNHLIYDSVKLRYFAKKTIYAKAVKHLNFTLVR